ncbi:hypothetical protein TNCV_3999361 [Trichonephila clavipes]|nr:hypothetical protein TNCV_3999361 [Trichonephila clavipes]
MPPPSPMGGDERMVRVVRDALRPVQVQTQRDEGDQRKDSNGTGKGVENQGSRVESGKGSLKNKLEKVLGENKRWETKEQEWKIEKVSGKWKKKVS